MLELEKEVWGVVVSQAPSQVLLAHAALLRNAISGSFQSYLEHKINRGVILHPLGSISDHLGTVTLKFSQEALCSIVDAKGLHCLLFLMVQICFQMVKEGLQSLFLWHVCMFCYSHLCKCYLYVQKLLTVDTGKARTLKRRSLLEITHLAHRSSLISLRTSARKDTP